LFPAAAGNRLPGMREFLVSALVLLCCLPVAAAQDGTEGWKTIKDSKSVCQISVPPEWAPLGENNGAAVLHDPSTGIAVVTSQPGQEFKPFTPAFLKSMGVPKDKVFENDATRIFYQDKTSQGPDDPNAFSSSVPMKAGTCSCHVVVTPSVAAETAKKIVLSLSAANGKT
jgi:hypothetical protein